MLLRVVVAFATALTLLPALGPATSFGSVSGAQRGGLNERYTQNLTVDTGVFSKKIPPFNAEHAPHAASLVGVLLKQGDMIVNYFGATATTSQGTTTVELAVAVKRTGPWDVAQMRNGRPSITRDRNHKVGLDAFALEPRFNLSHTAAVVRVAVATDTTRVTLHAPGATIYTVLDGALPGNTVIRAVITGKIGLALNVPVQPTPTETATPATQPTPEATQTPEQLKQTLDNWLSGPDRYPFPDDKRFLYNGKPEPLSYVDVGHIDYNTADYDWNPIYNSVLLGTSVVDDHLIGYMGFEDNSKNRFFIPYELGTELEGTVIPFTFVEASKNTLDRIETV